MVKPKEEPKKEEVKRAKVKIPKAKKYEDLPEIPDYERPELEIYEESEFDPTKMEKSVPTPLQKQEKGVESQAATAEPTKNGLPKVTYTIYSVVCTFNVHTPQFLFVTLTIPFIWNHFVKHMHTI